MNEKETEFRKTINQIIEMVTNLKLKKIPIQNIGFILNNKINEIGRFYKEKNLSLFDSLTYEAIEYYLGSITNQAIIYLQEYLKTFEKSILKEYKANCEKLFDFDIEKDLPLALFIRIEQELINVAIPYYTKMDNKTKTNCNEEIECLGYGKNYYIESFLFNNTKAIMNKLSIKIHATYGEKMPCIALALNYLVSKYSCFATPNSENLDFVLCFEYYQKLVNFNIEENIPKSIETVFNEVIKTEQEDITKDWECVVKELSQIGLDSKIEELESLIMTTKRIR